MKTRDIPRTAEAEACHIAKCDCLRLALREISAARLWSGSLRQINEDRMTLFLRKPGSWLREVPVIE